MSHTPGPWIAERVCLDGNEWSVRSTARDLPPFDWNQRLRVGLQPLHGYRASGARAGRGEGIPQSTEDGLLAIRENEANARLVAAAPDLLEACIAAKEYLVPDLVEPGRTVFWKLVAAIGKAVEGIQQ